MKKEKRVDKRQLRKDNDKRQRNERRKDRAEREQIKEAVIHDNESEEE